MKKIYYIYSILACLFAGMLFGCTADELEKDQPRDFSEVKIEVNATLSGYEGEKPATKLTDRGSWEYGDIIYMCVGSEENSFTLTYRGAGEWFLDSWLGGDKSSLSASSSGTLTAIYCTEGKNWKRSGGKIKGETHGDVVYTKKGKYEWVGDKLVFTINLDQRVVSKLVVEDVEPGWTLVQKTDYGADVQPWIALTQFLDPGWDPWFGGFDDPSYKYDSSTKKLTAWGQFGTTNNTFCIANADKTTIYARDYFSKGLNPGQKVTIKGPFGSEASEWRKYVDGNEIKKLDLYSSTGGNKWRKVSSSLEVGRARKIQLQFRDKSGKIVNFSGSDKAIFYIDDKDKIYTLSSSNSSVTLGGNNKGFTLLNIKLPPYYELEKNLYEVRVTDVYFEDRLQLYVAKRPDAPLSEYKLLNYYYDDVKKGQVRYLRIKNKSNKWELLGTENASGQHEFFEIKLDGANHTVKITPVLVSELGSSRRKISCYKIEILDDKASGLEISFKKKSEPTNFGDFCIIVK